MITVIPYIICYLWMTETTMYLPLHRLVIFRYSIHTMLVERNPTWIWIGTISQASKHLDLRKEHIKRIFPDK